MARGQQGGVTTGGGVDPYVQAAAGNRMQSAARKSEQSSSRAGAVQQQGMSQAHDTAMQQRQIQAAAMMQDKRAADAEAGKRQDNEFAMKRNAMDQKYWKEREDITNRAEQELQNGRLDFADKALQEDRDYQEYGKYLQMQSEAETRKTLLEMAKMQNRTGEAAQKLHSSELESLSMIEKGITRRDTATSMFAESMINNPAYTYENDYEGAPKSTDVRKEWYNIQTRDYNHNKVSRSFDKFIQEKYPDELRNFSTKLLGPHAKADLEQKLANGDIEITSLLELDGAIDANISYFDEMITKSTGEEQDYFKSESNLWRVYKSRLNQVQNSKVPIKGREKETVGMAAKREFGKLSGPPSEADRALLNSRIYEMQSEGTQEIIERLSKPLDPYGSTVNEDWLSLPYRSGKGRARLDKIINRINPEYQVPRAPEQSGEVNPIDVGGELGGY